MAIPGLGPLIAAGPIMAALTGAAVGGTVGGLPAALIGMDIPEFEAKRDEGKVKGGHALISVHSEDATETERAKSIFEAANAERYFDIERGCCQRQVTGCLKQQQTAKTG